MGIMSKHVKSQQEEARTQIPQDDVVPFKSLPSWMDPRPDLKADSELWFQLLQLAEKRSEEFQRVLNYFRCAGTRIRAKQDKTGWVLRPDIDTTGRRAWSSQEEYNEFKEKYLMPWIGTLGEILKELAERCPVR
ncbi:hypothetical protein [Paenibacillus ehimensis]|uniref:hypothetical protein n=1 Tax=Paenibacillus ehimensis TaxID=79264 RepID=UPI00046F33CB|nr:hypothetical protein [Paenibacillus ehimensis]